MSYGAAAAEDDRPYTFTVYSPSGARAFSLPVLTRIHQLVEIARASGFHRCRIKDDNHSLEFTWKTI